MPCQVCANVRPELFLDLGAQPACIFPTSREQFKTEKRYPLAVYFCPDCSLVQIGKPVDQSVLFGEDYHHIAALSSSFRSHLELLAKNTVMQFGLGREDLVVELGSNDGALLEAFIPHDVKVLGVDPSDVAEIAIKNRIDTIRAFFDEKLADKLMRSHGKAAAILAINTFAHVTHLDTFVRGVYNLLTNDGVFVSESHYVLDLIEGLQYDFIYHEHSRYSSVRTLVELFGKHGLEVFDVERIPTHSGSIRVFAGHKGTHGVSKRVGELLAGERAFGLDKSETYHRLAHEVIVHKEVFTEFLKAIKAAGHSIAGLTFPARAVTLLNYGGIGPETLDCITELSTLKIGRWSPGTHIPVVDQQVLFGKDAPDYGLLLSWHIAGEIIPRFRAKGFKGKFIIPLPTPRIVE